MGIKRFNDIIVVNGDVMTFQEVKEKIGICKNFLIYSKIFGIIPRKWKSLLKSMDCSTPEDYRHNSVLETTMS